MNILVIIKNQKTGFYLIVKNAKKKRKGKKKKEIDSPLKDPMWTTELKIYKQPEIKDMKTKKETVKGVLDEPTNKSIKDQKPKCKITKASISKYTTKGKKEVE